ncbi:MAG: hypothetical protein ACE5HN_08375 [Nitrospiria bacterium]
MSAFMRRSLVWIGIGVLFFTNTPRLFAFDADINISGLTTNLQGAFEDFSEELGLAISYLPVAPAEPLGILGFDIGVEATVAEIKQNRSYWTEITPDAPSVLFLPKVHAQKGLPFGIDVGAVYTKVPSSNIDMVGVEIKKALLTGNVLFPAIALRGSYTKLSGVPNLDMHTYGADVSISKGFLFLTPYAGYGQVWIQSEVKLPPPLNLKANITLPKPFVGVKISPLPVVNVVAEADFGKIPLYTFRINVGF